MAASLMQKAVRGFQAIATKAIGDTFALLEALTDSLEVVVQCLKEEGDNADAINAALTPLEALLATSTEIDGQSTAGMDNGSLSLNDLANWLIQMDPMQADDVDRLKELLEALLSDPGLPGQVTGFIQRGCQLAGVLDGAEEAEAENLIEQIGGLVENAIDAADGFEIVEQTVEEPQPVKTSTATAEDDSDARATAALESDVVGNEREIVPAEASEPDRTDYLPDDPDFEMMGEFVAEGGDLISSAEEALLTLETDPDDGEAVGMVFRAFHTVKGTAAFLDLTLVAEMGHHAESLLSRVRDQEIRYSGGYADLALKALDMIKEMIQAVEAAIGGAPLTKPEGYDELMKVLADPEAAGISEAAATAAAAPRLGDILVAEGKASREDVETVVAENRQQPLGVSMVKENKAKLADVGQALRTQEKIKSARKVESTVRVATNRLDRLIDMVGELVIAHSMVAQDEIVVSGNHHDLMKKVGHASKIVRELQDMSMSMRMVPLKSTFNKMARLVRDVARKVGKDVQLITEGEDTEIDRNLVDVINDPLVHMVRNAVDHGIELPEIREQMGKPPRGTICLSAYHAAGSVVVEIKDDGKGLDRDTILKKAREKGMVSEGATLSDREVFTMILEPGFSTAQEITDVSGRGVGMDVVKKNIESLRGQVEIRSQLGVGSTFKMGLPLTLAIIDGMVVRVGRDAYVIPTVSIVRSIKPEPQMLSTVMNQGRMMRLPEGLIPLFGLGDLYGIHSENKASDELVVVVEDKGRQAGLIIEELLGRQQVVIKSLGDSMRDIPGISGGAIMPNGRVGLILDVGGLMEFANCADAYQGEQIEAIA
jgi:two-component system chemotaxis sensor kinase CheA